MSVGVPFAVLEADFRHERAQGIGQISRDVGIGVLVDGDGAGGVWDDDGGDAVAAGERSERLLHLGGDDEVCSRAVVRREKVCSRSMVNDKRAARALSVIGYRLSRLWGQRCARNRHRQECLRQSPPHCNCPAPTQLTTDNR